MCIRDSKTVNSMVPLWQRKRSEVTDEEYNKFYSELTREFDKPPVSYTHLDVYKRQDEACGEACDGGGAGRALRALDDGRAVRTQAEVIDRFVAGEIENEVQALFIAANDEAVDKLLDDLAEGERHDGEIVALQAEHGRADEKADERGEKRADEHRAVSYTHLLRCRW